MIKEESEMLEDILSDDNLNLAYAKVMQNKGAPGVDGMRTEQLLPWLLAHGEALRQYVTGWAAQYRLADVERFLRDCAGWIGNDLQALFIEAWRGQDNPKGGQLEQDAVCHKGWFSEAQGQHACYPNEGWDFGLRAGRGR